MRKHAPLAAASKDVEEDGVEDLTRTVDPRPPMFLGDWHVRLYVGPFGIR
jgi:hypothetical protein